MKNIVEALEGRRLLSTVTWDGGAGTTSSTTPENWSGDHLPTSSDDVVVPASATSSGVHPVFDGATAYRSLSIQGYALIESESPGSLSIATELRVESGGYLAPRGGKIVGAGKLIVDAGGVVDGEGPPTLPQGGDVEVPVENRGTVYLTGLHDIGPAFHNYATTVALKNTAAYGTFYNEAGAVLSTETLGNATGADTFGLQRSSAGVISPAPFYNYGTVTTGSHYYGDVGPTYPNTPVSGGQTGIDLYVDALTTLGGQWDGKGGLLTFRSYNRTAPAGLALDSTFALKFGTLNLDQVNATVHGFAVDTALSVKSDTTVKTSVTIDQTNTQLSLLDLAANATVKLALGNAGARVLHVQDLRAASSTSIDVGDNLFIDGNQPGYLQPWIASPPAPSTLPSYQTSVRGSYNGVPLSLTGGVDPNSPTTAAVGFSTGSGVADQHSNHQLFGETFDNNDFVFLTTLRGDANFDRKVDFNDLVPLAMRYAMTATRGYADGNFFNPAVSRVTGFNDLVALAQNYGQTFSVVQIVAARTAAVPTKRGSVAKDVLS